MKYLIGIVCAVLISLLIHLLNTYVLKFHIFDFLCGWFSCMAYYISQQIYEWNKDN